MKVYALSFCGHENESCCDHENAISLNHSRLELLNICSTLKVAKEKARSWALYEFRYYMWDGNKRKRTIWTQKSEGYPWVCKLSEYYQLIIREIELDE